MTGSKPSSSASAAKKLAQSGPRHQKPASSPEPVRQHPRAARLSVKDRKNARARWLLAVAKEAHAKGGTWAGLGTLTMRFERASDKHPFEGKALVQVRAKGGYETVELAHVKPDAGQAGAPLVYWARLRGQGQRVLVEPAFVLAVVTAEHAAGGVATKLGGEEGTMAGPVDPAEIMREPS